MVQVLGPCNQVPCKGGGWLEPKPNKIQGASILGRGDLGGVEDVQLRVEVVIWLVWRGAGFAHLVTFSPLCFSYPFHSPNPPSTTPFLLLNPSRWAMYPLGAVPVGGDGGCERDRSGGARS